MLLKLIGVGIIASGAWVLGRSVSEGYKDKIKIIDSYIAFIKNFKSVVLFSGTNMYVFFSKNQDNNTKKFLNFLIDRKCNSALFEFKGANKIEDKCISLISESIILAEKTSDRELISDFLEECAYKLTCFKKEIMEEYRGKIKTAPSVGLMFGIFIAVLIV